MTQPRALILRAPGVNCDLETAHAFEKAGAQTESLHVRALLERPARVKDFQILCLPGGFSYGDDLGAGRILGNKIRFQLADVLAEFRDAGKLILGICNGFQILIKSGILLAIDQGGPTATLTNNESGKFEDRWVQLKVTSNKCVFFAGINELYLPVAHAEGKFVPRDERVLQQLANAGQIVLRYCHEPGREGVVSYPVNPNGSADDVAAVCDATGRVCGLMPHPERHIEATQHPRWTRRSEQPEHGDGFRVFQNAVAYFR